MANTNAPHSFKVFHFDAANGQHLATTDSIAKASSPLSSKLSAGTTVVFSRYTHDALLFVVACVEHSRALLQSHRSSYYFVPFFPFKTTTSWKDQIAYYLDRMFKSADFKSDRGVQVTLHLVTDIVLPKYADQIRQLVLFVDVSASCEGQCGTMPYRPYGWFSLEEITANSAELWGPEPFLYLINAHLPARCTDLSIHSEVKQSSKKWSLIQSLRYTEADIAALYSEYLQHCLPSRYMNAAMCTEYLAKSGLNLTVASKVNSPERLYNAFCITTGTFVTFKDLVYALAALERRCQHGDVGGELRTRCIFRYYTKMGAGVMEYDELMSLYEDIGTNGKSRRGGGNDAEDPETSATALFEHLKLNPTEGKISMDQFIDLVGSLTIRGTASLYRSTVSPLTEIRTKRCYDQLCAQEVPIERLIGRKSLPRRKRRSCPRQCNKTKYSLAMHSILYGLESMCVFGYVQEIPSELTTKYPRALRERSLESVNSASPLNKLRDVLRLYAATVYGFPNMPDTDLPRWDRKEHRYSLVDTILKLCLTARDLFRKGPRVVRCYSPMYVFGDIHGNLKDLMIFDQLLWRMAPTGFVANCLFLGDYVDRGAHSLECVLYLLCMKMLLPDKINLLRGNHEIRYIQQQFTFRTECTSKFGVALGANLWESINLVFDCMPLCATIDDQVYGAHGGIPASAIRMDSIVASISAPLANPLACKIAWEILWNDPATLEEYNAFLELCPPDLSPFPELPHGYMPNAKRGTAFYYSEDAVDTFADQNSLGFIVRAHEVVPQGFHFSLDGKVLTIFSSSNYCGCSNLAAVLFIDGSNGKMRVLQIETNQKFDPK